LHNLTLTSGKVADGFQNLGMSRIGLDGRDNSAGLRGEPGEQVTSSSTGSLEAGQRVTGDSVQPEAVTGWGWHVINPPPGGKINLRNDIVGVAASALAPSYEGIYVTEGRFVERPKVRPGVTIARTRIPVV
jgi:hypothetical protein